ncbi:Cysteine-rich secretory protein family protein [compost metagenome]
MKTSKLILTFGFLLSLSACSGGGGGGTGETEGSSSNQGGTAPPPAGSADCYSMDANSCAGFKATNASRIAHGVPAMVYCHACYQMAAEQSQDMAIRGYFDHTRPDETFAHRATRFGLASGAGENIASGKVGAPVVDEMWMNSSGHRANILNPGFKSFALGTYGTFTTQVFYSGTNK